MIFGVANTYAINVSDVIVSDCKDAYDESTPKAVLTVNLENNTAFCVLTNVLVNCASPTYDSIKLDINNDNIIMTICSEWWTSCSCIVDISFTLNNLSPGEYTFILQEECSLLNYTYPQHSFKIKFIEGETTSSSEHNSIDSILTDYSGIGIDYTNDMVSISGIKSTATLEIYDLIGTKVAEMSGEGEVSLSTETLPIGIYIVKATSDGKTSSRKIVVK